MLGRSEVPAAKVRPPHIGTLLLARPRLIQTLRQHLPRRILVLSAEAGYGKTSLLLSAAPELSLPMAWYTLDESDTEPVLFTAGLVEALRAVVPEFGDEVLDVLTAGPDLDTLRRRLLAALETLPDMVLVLDDLHAADGSPGVVELLDHLAARRPPQVRLALASRTTPPLPSLPRLLVEGNAYVLDRSALAFTPDEAAAFLLQSHGLTVSAPQAEQLVQRVEGWAAALQLSAIAAKSRGLSALHGTPREIFDYLAATVLGTLPATVREFLLRTSILSELWPDLCAAVGADGDPAGTLEFLDRSHLFVSRVDVAGTRYRYHQLFAEFLQAQLARRGREAVNELHRRAGAFLEANAVPDQAVRHYVAAEAYADAERVMRPLHGDRLNARLAYVLRELVSRLPPDVQWRYPWITRCGASASRFVGDYHRALELARRSMQAAAGAGDRNLWVFSAHGTAIMLQHLDRYAEAVALCRDVLARMPGPVEERYHSSMLVVLGDCLIALGRLAEAEEVIGELEVVAAEGARPGRGYGAAFLQGMIAAARLELSRSRDWFRRALAEGKERASLTAQVWALTAMARVDLWRLDLPAARATLSAAQDLHAQTGERATDLELTTLHGDLALLEGRPEAAERQYRQALAKWREGESEAPRVWALLGLARTARARADLPEAESLLAGAAQIAERIAYRFALPHIWLEQVGHFHLTGNHQGALDLLRRLTETFAAWHSAPGLVRSALLQARTQALAGGSAPAEVNRVVSEALLHAAGNQEDVVPFLQAEADWAVPLLLDALRADIRPDTARDLLARAGAPAVTRLLEALRDPALRTEVVRLLGRIGDARARRPLARLLRRSRPGERALVKEALALLQSPAPVSLRVFLFGRFEVFRGQERIPDAAWKTQKVRTLFKYLLLRRGHPVHEDEIIELLWPDAGRRAGATSLKTALTTLRKALEPLQEGVRSRFVLRRGDHLQFDPAAPCWVDVVEYAGLLEEARRAADAGRRDEAITLYERAVALYRGDLLEEDRYDDWAAAHRERWREAQVDALTSLARLYADRRETRRAAEVAERILELDRLRESACQDLIRYALAHGDRQRALRAFARLRQHLHEELGVEPQPETIALYEEALRSTAAPAGS